MTIELYADSIARLVLDFRAELLQHVHHILEVYVGAHRMREQRVQNFAMAMVHGRSIFGRG
jgi:hypothetical protein